MKVHFPVVMHSHWHTASCKPCLALNSPDDTEEEGQFMVIRVAFVLDTCESCMSIFFHGLTKIEFLMGKYQNVSFACRILPSEGWQTFVANNLHEPVNESYSMEVQKEIAVQTSWQFLKLGIMAPAKESTC
eukprot:CAMPEP_0169272772 /NCGR_PEP_ID=MMETSP1016-20121227/50680_1 /TAXON_ID=342587 /ORGANISM="Karlodinium micrum, Strain CCMP2283" /LENGTH=130 /DNA_ID=CAMNT_0009358909 /DNA_START=153 /DNA_END=545 /DNA_ORIENTATION=+